MGEFGAGAEVEACAASDGGSHGKVATLRSVSLDCQTCHGKKQKSKDKLAKVSSRFGTCSGEKLRVAQIGNSKLHKI